jgi:hypothetical protein
MKLRIRLEGVYDIRALLFCQSLTDPIDTLAFDLRPRSFNFLQIHILNQMMRNHYHPQKSYFLHFYEEKDFVINKILMDLDQTLHQSGDYAYARDNIYLEFSDAQNASFYDLFRRPFFWHYRPEQFKQVIGGQYFRGIVFSYKFFLELYEGKVLHNFVQNFLGSFHPDKFPQIILTLEWNDRPIEELGELLDFDWISLPVNREVESCYRNVDLKKLDSQLSVIRQLSI